MVRLSPVAGFWVVVALAALLRFAHLNAQGFWNDESLTLTNSPMAWPQMRVALAETESSKPPLYFLFMHEWLKGGGSETWARGPSAVFGALTCGFVFLLARRLAGPEAAWIAGLYCALSPFHLDYSQEARMYGLFGLESVVALWCLAAFLEEKRIGWLLGFGVASILVNYTFSYGFFVLGLAGLLLAARWRELGKRWALALLATLAISFASFLPWLILMAHAADSVATAQLYKGPPWPAIGYTLFALGYGFDLGPTTTDLQLSGAHYFTTHHGQALVVAIAFLVLLVLAGRGLWTIRRDPFRLIFYAGGVAIFLLGPAVVSLLKPNVTDNPRYGLLALFPFAILAALGAQALWRDGRWAKLVVVLYVVGLAVALEHYYFDPSYGREDLRGAAVLVANHQPAPEEVVVCSGHLTRVVERYYHGSATVLPFQPYSPGAFDQSTAQLNAPLGDPQYLAVIYARPDHGDPAHRFLPWLEQRFVVVEEKDLPGTQVYFMRRK